ncbi:MAG: GNAT family N-acetyltransferase [Verrucomicrobiales bacterium]|nr:GNAT family N-acetyltransferase [Verrucomicrobiales bacterium]
MNPSLDSDSPTVGDRILARGRGSYVLRHAAGAEDIRKAQRLRFEVFNLEMHEGLSASYATGLDSDPFDEVCDHLLVEDGAGLVVGTYRLQTGTTAAAKLGYYSEQEFDFAPFNGARREIVELGRACVHAQHRNLSVLSLLWKGIAAYSRAHGARYLVGCSSLTSQEPGDGAAMYALFRQKHLTEPAWQTRPQPAYACPMDRETDPPPRVPKLLGAYLSIGARICGPPAIDREFKTIDFLTFLDLQSLPMQIIQKYLT